MQLGRAKEQNYQTLRHVDNIAKVRPQRFLPKNRRHLIIIVLVLAVVLTLLASSLSTVDMSSSAGFFNITTQASVMDNDGERTVSAEPTRNSAFGDTIGSLIIWFLLPAALLFSFLTKEGRKRLRRDAMVILSVGLFAYIFGKFVLPGLSKPLADFLKMISGNGGDADALLFGNTPRTVVWAVTFFIATLIVGGGYLLWWRLQRKRNADLDGVAIDTRQALAELDKGATLRDVIIRYYAEMMKTAQAKHQLMREAALTPREFESGLVRVGLPADDVARLTRLFERVRYGAAAMGLDSAEAIEARQCLEAIVATCERAT